MKDALTLPNVITLSRIISIPFLVALFFSGPLWLFYTVLALVLASDLIDGALARAGRQITGLGKILDPLADKALFLSLFLALTVQGRLPWWAVLAFVLPPSILTMGALWLRWKSSHWVIIEARALGKASSTLLSTGLVGILLEPMLGSFFATLAIAVLSLGIVLSYAALGDYIAIALKQLKQFSRERGHKL